MARPTTAENLDDREYSESEVKRTAEGRENFKSLQDIKAIKRRIQKNLFGSTDILSEKERDQYFEKLERLDSHDAHRELTELEQEATIKTKEGQKMRKELESHLREDKDIAEIQDLVSDFVQLSHTEKASYVQEMKGKVAVIKKLPKSISPEKKAELLRMKLPELKNALEELSRREAKIKKYKDLLRKNNRDKEGNDHAYFSEDSIDEFEKELEDLPEKEIDEWTKKFPEQLETRKKLTDQFKTFNKERQLKFRHFYGLSRHEKAELIEDMETDQTNDYYKLLFDSREISHDSRHQALTWFVHRDRTIDEREDALKALQEHLKIEKKLWGEFESYPYQTRDRINKDFENIYQTVIKPQLKTDIKHQHAPRGFRDLSSPEREILLKHMKETAGESGKENEVDQKLIDEYGDLLKEAHSKHWIGQGTATSFLKWFKEEILPKDKTANKTKARRTIEEFWSNPEMKKRKEKLDVFDGLMKGFPEIVGPKQAEYYDASHTGRLRILKDINKEIGGGKEISEIKGLDQQVASLKLSAVMYEKLNKPANAIKIYKAILALKPDDLAASERLHKLQKNADKNSPEGKAQVSEEDLMIEQEIDETKKMDSIKQELTVANLANKLGKLARKNEEEYNKGQSSEAHLKGTEDGEKKVRLHREIEKETGGRKGLNEKGEAEDYLVIDQRRINELISGNGSGDQSKLNLYDLKQFVARREDETNQTASKIWNVRLKDERGRVEGRRGYEIGKQMMEKARKNLERKTTERIRARKGGKLDTEMAKKIEEHIKKTKLDQRFEIN